MTFLPNQGRETPDLFSVYYSGSDYIYAGYLLNYKHSATVDGSTNDDRFGVTVVQPATANLMFSAGIAAESKQGPCWIRCHRLGQRGTVDASVKANATAGTTLLGGANASYSLAAISQSGADLGVVAIAAVTANTASTAANKRVMLL